MNNYLVYKHTAPNNKVYIGITSQNPSRRWQKGRGYIHNEYFYRAILKYGWDNISHEILFDGLSKSEAESKEIELIAKYKCDQKEFGYNIQHGGNYSGKHSEESKLKMSKTRKGKVINNITKQKMSESHIDKPIVQLTDDGKIIAIWNGCKTASKSLNIPFQNISECVKHKGYRKHAGGYVWRYVDDVHVK